VTAAIFAVVADLHIDGAPCQLLNLQSAGEVWRRERSMRVPCGSLARSC
jgi:hypothetical protein